MSPFMSYCYRFISMTTTVFSIHPIAMSECLKFKLWNCRNLRHTTMKSIFFYVNFDFDFALFSHKQIYYHEKKCLFYQMKFDLQRYGYSMEYHGNHYFFNIKSSVFATRRSDVSYLIQLCTCYIKYFMFQVKCTGFPFWVSGLDTLTPTL